MIDRNADLCAHIIVEGEEADYWRSAHLDFNLCRLRFQMSDQQHNEDLKWYRFPPGASSLALQMSQCHLLLPLDIRLLSIIGNCSIFIEVTYQSYRMLSSSIISWRHFSYLTELINCFIIGYLGHKADLLLIWLQIVLGLRNHEWRRILVLLLRHPRNHLSKTHFYPTRYPLYRLFQKHFLLHLVNYISVIFAFEVQALHCWTYSIVSMRQRDKDGDYHRFFQCHKMSIFEVKVNQGFLWLFCLLWYSKDERAYCFGTWRLSPVDAQ